MARLFCERCKAEAQFVSVTTASNMLDVCRSTIYYWIDHGWVHWYELPSGRRLLCMCSLARTDYHNRAMPASSERPLPGGMVANYAAKRRC